MTLGKTPTKVHITSIIKAKIIFFISNINIVNQKIFLNLLMHNYYNNFLCNCRINLSLVTRLGRCERYLWKHDSFLLCQHISTCLKCQNKLTKIMTTHWYTFVCNVKNLNCNPNNQYIRFFLFNTKYTSGLILDIHVTKYDTFILLFSCLISQWTN